MPTANSIHPENYRFLQQLVYTGSGIVLEEGKEYLFECRLSPIVTRHGLTSIDTLCTLLRGGRNDLSRQVVEAMTTNETFFFRDPAHYSAIRGHLLQQLRLKRGSGRRLRFWSAAASAGQEAYSLALLLLEEGFNPWDIEIVGTDLSSAILERARAARYQQIEVNRGLPVSLLVKYFNRSGVDWELSETVRRLVRFEELDLRSRVRDLGVFDLVFCRNVLIYFDPPTRLKIIEQIQTCLWPGGWLLLGGAETAPGIDAWFERQTLSNASVYVAR